MIMEIGWLIKCDDNCWTVRMPRASPSTEWLRFLSFARWKTSLRVSIRESVKTSRCGPEPASPGYERPNTRVHQLALSFRQLFQTIDSLCTDSSRRRVGVFNVREPPNKI